MALDHEHDTEGIDSQTQARRHDRDVPGPCLVCGMDGPKRCSTPWLFVAFPGFAVFFAGNWYLLFLLRCPRCRGRIGGTVSYLSGPFSISRKIRFCPFCGVALDSELEAHRVV